MEQALHIAPCRDQDTAAVMRFLDEQWARNHVLSRDETLLRWQYDASLRDGRAGPPSILLAWRADEIVGMLGLTYMRWIQDGQIYLGAWTSHWFVRPELRESPLSLLLLRRASQLGAQIIGSVGVNDRAVGIICHLGYEIIREIPRWVAVIDPVKTATLLAAAGVDDSPSDALLSFCRERTIPERTPAHRDSEWEVSEWSDDVAAEWDVCWEHCLQSRFTGVVRDSAYIRWRYVAHPTFRYEVRVARHRTSGNVGGLLVSRLETVKDRTERVLRIVELLTYGRPATDCLLDDFARRARDAAVAFTDFYCTSAIDGLADAGFRHEEVANRPFAIPFRLQPLEPGERPLNAAIKLPASLRGTLGEAAARGALYLTKSDGDQDRPN
jgi:hypothetical protein